MCHHDFIDNEFDLKTFVVNFFNWIGDNELLGEKHNKIVGVMDDTTNSNIPPDAASKRKKVVPVQHHSICESVGFITTPMNNIQNCFSPPEEFI